MTRTMIILRIQICFVWIRNIRREPNKYALPADFKGNGQISVFFLYARYYTFRGINAAVLRIYTGAGEYGGAQAERIRKV